MKNRESFVSFAACHIRREWPVMHHAARHALQPIFSRTSVSPPGGAERMLYVLTLLAQQAQPVSAAELAEVSGLATSTLYRQLAVLKSWGFVQESGAYYMPGPTCLQLARGFDQGSWLVREALPEMQRLSEVTNETVGLMVIAHDQMVCLDMVESRHSLRCTFVKGQGLPLFFGASAKSLLAYLPALKRAALLNEALSSQVLNIEQCAQLEKEITSIRQHGYAMSSNEVDEGIWGISIPLLLDKHKLLGTMTLMAPVSRAGTQTQRFIQHTRHYAERIITRLHSLA